MGDLIGVLGGTFDPPHLAHLILADEARYALNLKKVLWVVTAQPPHKPDQPISPVEHRLAMVSLAIESDPTFEISPADLERTPPHYAHGTLDWLSVKYPGGRFAYLMGEDSLRDLPEWNDPQRFVDSCERIAVMDRLAPDYDLAQLEANLPGLKEKYFHLGIPPVMISASEIRSRVREARPFRYLLPDAVAEYIIKNRLYT